MFIERKMLVKNNTKIADTRRKQNCRVVDDDGFWKGGIMLKFLVSEKHELRFAGVDIELVASKPGSKVVDAITYL